MSKSLPPLENQLREDVRCTNCGAYASLELENLISTLTDWIQGDVNNDKLVVAYMRFKQ